MKNFNIKSEFVLEKFQFDQNFTIPPVKNMNADSVINIYENMRDFFPKYQENNHDIILAPRLGDILDNFEALLLDSFGVLNVGSSLVPGIIKTL